MRSHKGTENLYWNSLELLDRRPLHDEVVAYDLRNVFQPVPKDFLLAHTKSTDMCQRQRLTCLQTVFDAVRADVTVVLSAVDFLRDNVSSVPGVCTSSGYPRVFTAFHLVVNGRTQALFLIDEEQSETSSRPWNMKAASPFHAHRSVCNPSACCLGCE